MPKNVEEITEETTENLSCSVDGFNMPFIRGEIATCSCGCGKRILEGGLVMSNINLPYASKEHLDMFYRQIGVYDLIYKPSKLIHEDRSTGDRESFRAKSPQ